MQFSDIILQNEKKTGKYHKRNFPKSRWVETRRLNMNLNAYFHNEEIENSKKSVCIFALNRSIVFSRISCTTDKIPSDHMFAYVSHMQW